MKGMGGGKLRLETYRNVCEATAGQANLKKGIGRRAHAKAWQLTFEDKRLTLDSIELEFDPEKEKFNVIKHGIDFSTVEEVFADPFRLIIPNSVHSTPKEKRFYAIGHDGRGVLTIRFTMRGSSIRIIGAGYWRKQASLYEKNKIQNQL